MRADWEGPYVERLSMEPAAVDLSQANRRAGAGQSRQVQRRALDPGRGGGRDRWTGSGAWLIGPVQ